MKKACDKAYCAIFSWLSAQRLSLARKLEALYHAGFLDRSRLVDEPLEVEFDEFRRRIGRRTKMGAAMMAPDYTWWHGFYALKKRYTSIMAAAARAK